MLRFFVTLLLLLGTTELFAQSKLPEDAGSQFLEVMREKSGGVAVPLGTIPVPSQFIENGKLLPTNELARNMLALERLGIVKITVASPNVSFDLIAKPDGKTMRLTTLPREGTQGLFIASLDYSSARVELGKIEYVNKGQGKSYAIAYGVIQGVKYFPIRKELAKATDEPDSPSPDARYRLLFREDVFVGKWKFVTFDYFDGQKFLSEKVPNTLARE